MTRTLLVELDLEDPGILPDLALEVQSILSDAGLNIISVRPWQSPNESAPVQSPVLF